jgi:glutamate racemase
VPLIESGKVDSPETKALLEEYLDPMVASGIDYLVLGCTHYPYLLPVLKTVLPAHVKIIDSGQAVARQTKAILVKNDLLTSSKKNGTYRFITNAKVEILEYFLEDFRGTLEVTYQDF